MSDELRHPVTVIRDMDVDFIYSFTPVYITRIELKGNRAFKDRTLISHVDDPANPGRVDWVADEDGWFTINIPVNQMLSVVRLSVRAGEEAKFESIRFYFRNIVNSEPQGNEILLTDMIQGQRLNLEVQTFLGQAREETSIDLQSLTDLSPQDSPAGTTWVLTNDGWRVSPGNNISSTRTRSLRFDFRFDGNPYELEAVLSWDVRITDTWNDGIAGTLMVGPIRRVGDTSSGNNLFDRPGYRGRSNQQRISDGESVLRVPVDLNQRSPNGEDFVAGNDYTLTLTAETLRTDRATFGLRSVKWVSSAHNVVRGGMAGEVLYATDSNSARKVCRIELLMSDNARARLEKVELFGRIDEPPLFSWDNKDEDWGQEDTGVLKMQRWLQVIPQPQRQFVRFLRLTFNDGSDFLTHHPITIETTNYLPSVVAIGVPTDNPEGGDYRSVIGQGFLYRVNMWEEGQLDEFDAAIDVRLGVELNDTIARNEQTGTFFYSGQDGFEHVVAVNELAFTEQEFAQVLDGHEPQTVTTLRLSTAKGDDTVGSILGMVMGEINIDCLRELGLH